MADSWEDAHHLDSCPQALSEYWHHISVNHDRTTTPILGGNTAVVRGRMKQARALRASKAQASIALAQTGRAFYEIPPGDTLLPEYPGAHFRSKLCEGLRVLIVWPNNEGDADEHSQWYDGKIVSYANPTATAKGKQAKRSCVYWHMKLRICWSDLHVQLTTIAKNGSMLCVTCFCTSTATWVR